MERCVVDVPSLLHILGRGGGGGRRRQRAEGPKAASLFVGSALRPPEGMIYDEGG